MKFDIEKSSEREKPQLKSLASFVNNFFNDAVNNQQGQGLKIIIPKQMIIRLFILLAQLKARNNNQKLKNEIRQIAYSCTDQKIYQN